MLPWHIHVWAVFQSIHSHTSYPAIHQWIDLLSPEILSSYACCLKPQLVERRLPTEIDHSGRPVHAIPHDCISLDSSDGEQPQPGGVTRMCQVCATLHFPRSAGQARASHGSARPARSIAATCLLYIVCPEPNVHAALGIVSCSCRLHVLARSGLSLRCNTERPGTEK